MWGALAQASATTLGAVGSYFSQKEANKIARQNLDEVKKMNQWEKDKYNQTMTNQTAAMSTLGDSFGKALKNESAPAAPNAQAPDPQAENKEPNAPLPTERM